MTSRSYSSGEGLRNDLRYSGYHGYGKSRQTISNSWFSSNYMQPPRENNRVFDDDIINEDDVIRDDTIPERHIPFYSYRVKTNEKHEAYEQLNDLYFRHLYMGLVRNTTAHGLPHIHSANGCIKRTFWSILTLFLIATWLWNSHEVLSSFLAFGVTVSYDIRLAHEVQFPAVTICNQNVARSSEMRKDPQADEILSKSSDELYNRNGKGGQSGSAPSGGAGGSGPSAVGPGGAAGPSVSGGAGGSGPAAGGAAGGQGSAAGGGASGPSVSGGASSAGGSGPAVGGQGSAAGAAAGPGTGGGSVSGPGASGGASNPSAAGSNIGGGGSNPAGGDTVAALLSRRSVAGVAATGFLLGASADSQSTPSPVQQPPPTQAPKSPDKPGGLATEKNEIAQRKILIQEFLVSIDSETRIQYGHQFSPLISMASYSGYTVYNTTFKRTYDLNYGNCYTFNTGANDTEEPLMAYNTGPDYGLSIVFAIEEAEYLSEITNKQGLRIVIHNPATPPFPNEVGLDIAPGMATSIGVRKVTIKRLGGVYNQCINMSKSHADINVYEELYDWTLYTIIGCQKTCYQQEVIKACGCFDQGFPSRGMAFANESTIGVCSYSNETEDDCRTNIYSDLRNGLLMCSQCQKPCTEEFFERSLSTAMWPATRYITTLLEQFEDDPFVYDMLKSHQYPNNLGLLQVYFESLNLEDMQEQPAYDVSQFIADIGGTIGLWVGASMMTIFEFGEFFLDSLVLLCARCMCRSRKRRDEHPPDRQRRNHVVAGFPLRQVYDPETKWHYAPTAARASFGPRLRSTNWINPDPRSRAHHSRQNTKFNNRNNNDDNQ